MRHFIPIFIFLFLIFPLSADRHARHKEILEKLAERDFLLHNGVDTVINLDGYNLKLIQSGEDSIHIGLNLFNDRVKNSMDEDMLNYVEAVLLGKVFHTEDGENTDCTFLEGDFTDFKNLNDETSCKISNINSRFLSFEWNLNSGKKLKMEVPISYEYAKQGTRSEIENNFLRKIKTTNVKRRDWLSPELNQLEPYGKGVYKWPGNNYLTEEINRNTYFTIDTVAVPIWSIHHPIESISNLFILPNTEKVSAKVEITVLKHEFGERDTLFTSIENLLSACEDDGCTPYWGVEDFKDGVLSGSLFLNNWKQGYNHVFKIECNPNEILNGKGTIKARASLYIPTNNIQSLFDSIQ